MQSLLFFLLVGTLARAHASEDHALFTRLLEDHVRAGLVDYASLKQDPRLQIYCEKLSQTDPAALPGRETRMAFWINAYNAFTLKVIVENYPLESINDLHGGGLALGTLFNTTIWDKKLFTVAGKKISLNHIEHKILRKQYEDPRIHFALVCASRSCPELRPEAYRGEDLNAQLDEQARSFLADTSRNSFDLRAKRAEVSKIFDWFAKDFGGKRRRVLLTLAPYLPAPVQEAVRSAPDDWKISYKKYDWGLNDSSRPAS